MDGKKMDGKNMSGKNMSGKNMGGKNMGGEEMGAEEAPVEAPEEMMEMVDEYESEAPEKPRVPKIKGHGIEDKHAVKVEDMIESLFSESKVDQILKKYFKIDEQEKVITEQKKNVKKEMIKIQSDLLL